jgi:predicted ferric reductase
MLSAVFAASKLWWYVSRSAGIVSWTLLALAVLWGLALSTRALGKRPAGPWLLDVHRFIGGLSVLFVLVHMLGLFLDTYEPFSLTQLLVPYAKDYKAGAVAWGIVAFYILLAVEGTSLLRKHLPKRFWHGVHLASYALYAFATIHLLTVGTDRQNPLLRWSVIGSIGVVVFFTAYRIIGPGRAGSIKSTAPKP